MDYAAVAPHAAAPPPPAVDPQRPRYPQPPGFPYPYAAYHQPDPAAGPSASAASSSSSYYYANPTAPADAGVPYNHYSAYQYYGAPAMAGAGGMAGYYFSAGEASQAPAVPAAQAAPAATGREAGKHFGFDPQRYAQVAAAKAPNRLAPTAAAIGMHHAHWNAHLVHPLPKNVLRKHMKKIPKVVQPATCEVCKIQCDTLDVLRIHKTGRKHKKNLEKLQDSITPKPAKPLNNAVGANTVAAAVADGAVPAVQPKKNKSSSATPEDLEVKKRRVLEAGAAQGEVKICTACNVVVNSQKVYEFHIVGQKHKANVQKQQQAQPHPI